VTAQTGHWLTETVIAHIATPLTHTRGQVWGNAESTRSFRQNHSSDSNVHGSTQANSLSGNFHLPYEAAKPFHQENFHLLFSFFGSFGSFWYGLSNFSSFLALALFVGFFTVSSFFSKKKKKEKAIDEMAETQGSFHGAGENRFRTKLPEKERRKKKKKKKSQKPLPKVSFPHVEDARQFRTLLNSFMDSSSKVFFEIEKNPMYHLELIGHAKALLSCCENFELNAIAFSFAESQGRCKRAFEELTNHVTELEKVLLEKRPSVQRWSLAQADRIALCVKGVLGCVKNLIDFNENDVIVVVAQNIELCRKATDALEHAKSHIPKHKVFFFFFFFFFFLFFFF
jgi:ribosomal 30S subunit maturation factor RimM